MIDPGSIYRSFPAQTLAAGEKRLIPGRFVSLFVLSATDRTSLQFSFNGSDFHTIPEGISIKGIDVTPGVWVVNTSGAPNTIQLASGSADIEDTRGNSATGGNATAALQTSGNASLASINGKLPAALVGGRLDVNVGASALPTGASTEATLSTASTTLTAISGKLPAALVGGRLDGNIGAINNVTPLMGNGASGTGSLRVTIATDAHSAATTLGPVGVGGRVATAVDTTLAANDRADLQTTTGGTLVTTQNSVPEVKWTYAAAASGIVNTVTAVTFKAAAAAGVRNYCTGIDVSTDVLTAASEIAIRDGAAGTVLWRGRLVVGANRFSVTFDDPLRGTAATLMEVVTLTATGAALGVYFNARGYTAP